MHQFISGTFDDPALANKAVDDIIALDYPRDRITIIMSTQTLSMRSFARLHRALTERVPPDEAVRTETAARLRSLPQL